jgi:cytochrome c55X
LIRIKFDIDTWVLTLNLPKSQSDRRIIWAMFIGMDLNVPSPFRLFERCTPCTRIGLFKTCFVLGMVCVAASASAESSLVIEPARQRELVTLVRQDCGSCHGLTLQGGLGPALLPDALKDKPADYLKLVILQGRFGTAMPPWRRFLSDAEAEWIVTHLQRGFPREF